jgi:hypothetical protein
MLFIIFAVTVLYILIVSALYFYSPWDLSDIFGGICFISFILTIISGIVYALIAKTVDVQTLLLISGISTILHFAMSGVTSEASNTYDDCP